MPKKPTNKEIVGEINHLGQRLMMLESIVQRYVSAVDMYIQFQGNDEKFKDFLVKKAKDLKEKESKED
tara:strand:- start:449 stop:652 length:204 start_codon:yes stop_codon:yes gene_type:complete